MVATKRYAEYVKAAVRSGVDLIISGAGLPTMLPELVKDSKTKIAPIVSTIKSASVILKMWERKSGRLPDLVVIEGPRAGGHLGFSPDQLDHFTPEIYEEEIKGIIGVVKGMPTNTKPIYQLWLQAESITEQISIMHWNLAQMACRWEPVLLQLTSVTPVMLTNRLI